MLKNINSKNDPLLLCKKNVNLLGSGAPKGMLSKVWSGNLPLVTKQVYLNFSFCINNDWLENSG